MAYEVMATVGSNQSGRQGAECETPPHSIHSPQQVKGATEATDRLNS